MSSGKYFLRGSLPTIVQRLMRRFVQVCLPVILLAGPALLSANVMANDAAVKLVSDTTDAIKLAIKKDQDALSKDRERLMALVDAIVLPHFDFAKMSSWALGKSWEKASDSQKKIFASEFRKLLVRTYAAALLDNVDRKISILPLADDANSDKVIVRTEAEQDGGFPIPLNYKMHLNGKDWKVYDVVIDGVSLVANYRTSFAREIRKSGIDSVIASLQKRNESAIK